MNFNTDNSTQTISSLTTSANYDGFALNSALTTGLNTKQDTLTASTNLLGVGSAISALDYNKIINKPTNFQADYNSTLINKPTNFQCDYNSTLINKPTNFQADWNSTVINKPDLTVYNAWTKNVNDIYTTITAGNVGIGTNITTTYKLTVNGSLNATSLYIAGTLINFSSYQPIINTYTITGATGGSLSYSANTLTLAMPTTYTSLSIASLTSATSIFYKGFEISATYATIANLNLKENALTFSAPLTRTTNTIGIDLSTYQPLLTFSSPLSKTANTVSIDLSTYSTTSINDTKYLKLDGTNSMTGTLNINTNAGPQIGLKLNTNNSTSSIVFYNNLLLNNDIAYIGIGGSALTGYYNNNLYLETRNSIIFQSGGIGLSANVPRMIINSVGNIGIATTNPNNILQVGNAGRLKIGLGSTDYSLIGTLDTDGATNTRIVISGNTRTTYAGNIDYLATSTGNHLFYTTDTNIERVRIKSDGNVGIGTNNPTAKLHIEHSSTATNPSTSGLYVYNPNNSANHSSVIGCRIGGSTANKAIYSLDVNGNYGWSMYISGSDTTNKLLRFNSGWDTLGSDRFSIAYNGQLTRAYDIWHKSYDGIDREYYQFNGTTFFKSGNGSFIFRNLSESADNFSLDNSGNATLRNSLYINNPFGRITHLPYLGNNENYIRGKVNIDQDQLYVGGAVIFNSTLAVANGTALNGGLSHKTFIQPIIVSYTYYGSGNPWTITSYNKNGTNTNPFCIYYVTAGAYFGIYLGFNITSGSAFAPTLYYNGGITNYIPYFTNNQTNATIMWIYNAQAGIQVSVVEYWFA